MSTTESDRFDPARRRLCPDGACIGLLDQAGRCKVCGLGASGAAAPAAKSSVAPEEPELRDLGREPDADSGSDESALEAAAGEFDRRRKLCPDGACIGVVGADGRCKVCGRAEAS